MIITAICMTPGQTPEQPIPAGGRTVFAPEIASIAACFTDANALVAQPLLAETEAEPGFLGLPNREDVHRAREAISALLEHKADCIIAVPPGFLRVLLNRMAKHGFVVRRSESGNFKPFERIRVSEKRDHCGGCSHNCLLRSPGCGIGMDKARRLGIEKN